MIAKLTLVTGVLRKNIPDYLGEKTSGAIFGIRNDDNETYKAHEETFLREVCSVMYVET